MAGISLVAADRLRVVESIEQMTLPPEAGVTIAVGDIVKFGTNGGWDLMDAGDAGYGVAVGKSNSGMGITAIRVGVLDGFNLSALAYAAVVGIVTAAPGKLDTAPLTGDEIGSVQPAHAQTLGSAMSKLLHVDLGQP